MKHGFFRLATASPELRVADCRYNTQQTISAMEAAVQDGVGLVVFPELGITGYTCGDLFGQRALLDGALEGLKAVTRASGHLGLMAIVGLPLLYRQKLYNCAAVVCAGELLGIVPKVHLPNYDEFEELRWFTPALPANTSVSIDGRDIPFGSRLLFACRERPELVVAAEICADLWAPLPPCTHHALAGATVIVNLSASDELVGKAESRLRLVQSQSARLVCGYLYAGAGEGESTAGMVFAGNRLIAENGQILAQSPLFTPGVTAADLDLERLCAERRRQTSFAAHRPDDYRVIEFSLPTPKQQIFTREVPRFPFVPAEPAALADCCRTILDIQAAGLRKRIVHTGCKKVLIGVSGGLDSTLALLVCARAMDDLSRPRTDVLAVTMPCFGTTSRTHANAQRLCKALGVELRTVDITAAVRQHFTDIGQPEDLLDVTFENSQARERTQVLMDLANRHSGLVVGTGDLSELALGWATYNGDHMSMYGVNASIPKTLLRHLVRYLADATDNALLRETLLDVLNTPVSPELLPARDGEISQKTEDLVGPYELHDFFLYYFLRFGFTPDKIRWLALRAFEGVYAPEVITRWLEVFLRRFFSQQFKRSCLPDGPKVGSVGLSPRDWHMPSDACCDLWMASLPPEAGSLFSR